MPLPESPLVTHGRDSCIAFQVYLDKATEHYFNITLRLQHGWRVRLLAYLMAELAKACETAGLQSWDVDIEEKVMAVLAKMNFNEVKPNGKSKPKSKSAPSA